MLVEKKKSDKRCFNIISKETIVELELPKIQGRDLLAFAKPGDKKWIQISFLFLFDDINYFNDNFFAVRITSYM